MTSHSIAVGLAILACLGLLHSILVALVSPLRKVPGPVSARFTNLFYLNRVRHGRFHYENKALHHKYGPVLRLGEDLVSIDDPSALKTIYGSKWLGRGPLVCETAVKSDMGMRMGIRIHMKSSSAVFVLSGNRINSLTKL